MQQAVGVAVIFRVARLRLRPPAALLAATTLVAVIAGQGAPPAASRGVEIWPDFVEIPGGVFTMGADPARDPRAFDNERWSPAGGAGTVDVPTFLIARHEVTIAQFAVFARSSGWTVDPKSVEGPPAHPAAFLSWPDALAYARWLDAALRTSPDAPPTVAARLRDGWQVRLPSEAEWEKAARGTDGRAYPWGSEPRRDRANFEGTAVAAVGQFPCPECAHGLADMSGNVWEWTISPNQPYPYDPSDDRTGLDQDALWIMRGGSYGDNARTVRTTTRGAADPGARRPFIGFRVVVARR